MTFRLQGSTCAASAFAALGDARWPSRQRRATVTPPPPKFTVPAGFEVVRVAGPPLVDRPIVADFDERGRLYVADSSGSNDKVEKQLADRPHRIVRLEDKDGDGTFDTSVVFADRMMLPQGAMWFDGSLYVGAPPSIWKLTDTNDDGVADTREEWFAGKTLTACANDLHGPYLGPDGWIYWTKGAFAEQTYERPGKPPLVTRAAHVFRRRPGETLVEPVIAGGMDNPVDVAFTPSGEAMLTATFLEHPQLGRRDAFIHAVYGGLFGKPHNVIDGHPQTGDLMPPVSHFGAAAVSGLTHYASRVFGDGYRDNFFAALFNMQKVTRHVLEPSGATFKSRDSDFLVADSLDFHPTDVIEDADGSLLVVDTGAWYKLCCPTSQLAKPDVLGAIYRVRRRAAPAMQDPRGLKIGWATLTPVELAARLDDARPAVQRRAIEQLAELESQAVPALGSVVAKGRTATQRRNAIWALTRNATAEARAAIRPALGDADLSVRLAALHSVGLWRDADVGSATARGGCIPAPGRATRRRRGAGPHRRSARRARAAHRRGSAARPRGRAFGDLRAHRDRRSGIDRGGADEPVAPLTARGTLRTRPDAQRRTAGGHSRCLARVARRGNARYRVAHRRATSGLGRTPLPGISTSGWRRSTRAPRNWNNCSRGWRSLAATRPIQQELGRGPEPVNAARRSRAAALRAMASSRVKELPEPWLAPLVDAMSGGEPDIAQLAVAVARSAPVSPSASTDLQAALLLVARDPSRPTAVRLDALGLAQQGVAAGDRGPVRAPARPASIRGSPSPCARLPPPSSRRPGSTAISYRCWSTWCGRPARSSCRDCSRPSTRRR